MRFGLIGTGHWAATVHAPGIVSHPDAELAGVWGRDPARSESLAAQFGARPFSDVDELIAAVDAVAFSVPPDVQAEFAVRAGSAGRALLLEKPLALTVESAERVVEAARAHTAVFFTRRFDPAVRSWFDTEVDSHDWDDGSVTMSPAELTETVFWGEAGLARMPEGVDVAAAYAGAIDAVLAGGTPFDAAFGREVVRVLASAEEAGAGGRPPPTAVAT